MIDIISQTGYRKPISTHTVADKESVASAIINYHLMIKVKSCMDQFMEGLQALGLLQKIQSSPSLWEPLFINSSTPLTPGMKVKTLFGIIIFCV